MKEVKIRTCSSLKKGENVIFLRSWQSADNLIPEIGTVDLVNTDNKTVEINWLEGYKNRDSCIPFNRLLAVFNPEGVDLHYKGISGPSDKLIPE